MRKGGRKKKKTTEERKKEEQMTDFFSCQKFYLISKFTRLKYRLMLFLQYLTERSLLEKLTDNTIKMQILKEKILNKVEDQERRRKH